MNATPWILLALLIAGVVVVLAAAHTRRSLPAIHLPEGESLPSTLVQRYAGWTLAVVVLLTAIAAGILIHTGPQVWWDNDAVRLTITFVLLAALCTYFVFMITVRSLQKRGDGSFDERDGAIMGRSSAGVGGAMMTVAAVWMISLTETYVATRLMPSYFLQFIFWSLVMTNVIASLAGILLAYRRN